MGEILRSFLLSGEVLCELVNAAAARTRSRAPGVSAGEAERPLIECDAEVLPIPMYHKGAIRFHKQMENVSQFIRACRDFFSVPEHQLFCTNDLSEGRDMQSVVRCLVALGSRIQVMYPDSSGPRLGVPDYHRASPRLSLKDAALGES